MEFMSLHQNISNMVAKFPNKVAIEYGEKTVSYQEFDERVNQIANFFNGKLNDNPNIVVLLDNCDLLVEAMVGIFKCGGIFIPLDPLYPDDRLKVMMNIVNADWVITNTTWLDKLGRIIDGKKKKVGVLTLDFDDDLSLQMENIQIWKFDENVSTENLYTSEIQSKHCYIYFTSGSTGRPKAILGRHKSLKQFIDWEIQLLNLQDNCRIAQFTTPSFDAYMRNVLLALCTGGTLCIIEDSEIVLNPKKLYNWIDQQAITLTHMVPALFKTMVTEIEDAKGFKHLQFIILAGELLRGSDVKKFFTLYGERIQLYNFYGPTETTLTKTYYRVQPEDVQRVAISVGKPMDKAQILVLDDQLQHCPVGSIGEVYIRSPYITSGYYRDIESTKKVFMRNPLNNNPQDIIYKTGDLGRILPDGDLEILGRIDHQVKIHGVRIELGEIEHQLLKIAGIKECVVVAREDSEGNKYLCAYLVLNTEIESLDNAVLRETLAQTLPTVMIPGYFVQLDRLPNTPNGKIDRKALPEPHVVNMGAKYVAPENELEEELVRIWSEVLGKDKIGVEYNFFELGGHSLKAANLVARIHKELKVLIPLKEIFDKPTIRRLAKYIQQSNESHYASIEPVEEQDYYPVSSAQKRLYVLSKFEGISTSYNMPRALMVEGPVNREKLEQSFKSLIDRHETLRTSFDTMEGEIVQHVHQDVPFSISYLKMDTLDVDSAQIAQIIHEFIKPFDLSKAPLLRVGLVEINQTKHLLLFDMHHIISDGSSMNILVQDFLQLYQGEELTKLPIQYKDFAVWQNKLFDSEEIQEQERYWLELFDDSQNGKIPVLNMPTDYPRPPVQTFNGNRWIFEADSVLTDKLNKLVQETETTMYMVLLAGFNVLLARYSNQEDIVIGSPIAGRPYVDLENIIGIFINTLAMRNQPKGDLTFKEFVTQLKENALKAFNSQDYQFEQLLEKLKVPRNLSRNPLFDMMFVLHNNTYTDLEITGLKFSAVNFEKTVSKFDMTLNAEEQQGGIFFNLEYSTSLFKQETIERFAIHYLNVLNQVCDHLDTPLAQIDLLSPSEKEHLLFTFNDTETVYPQNKTLHNLFAEQVVRTPEEIALIMGDKQITYRELDLRANQVAEFLGEKGVRADQFVAIMVKRSIEMIIGILGIIKAGGAYLPIDPEFPEDRIRYMLEDSNARIVLTHQRVERLIPAMEIEKVNLDTENWQRATKVPEVSVGKPSDLAYIIYTSGSTGKPKGVMIEHRAVVNFIQGITDIIEFAQGQSILALTTISFDIFTLETILPLTRGLKVIIANEHEQKDTRALYQVIVNHNIDILQMTPSRMRMLLNDEKSSQALAQVQKILVGGEAVPETLLEEIKAVSKARIYNMYGPTETTVWSTVQDLTDTETVNIGKPIANTGIYILGTADKLQPIGVPGELCIAGEGLARGYWNSPELTHNKFVTNPYADSGEIHSKRMYRTGDLARWLSDGSLEFSGRIDHQVKIRGYRIEPGEIESQLLKHENVQDVVVVVREASGGAYLCAYLVVTGEVQPNALREHLAHNLPEYMIPTYYIQLEKLPYTPNGKIDRNALPTPEASLHTGVEYVAPTNEIEAKLVRIWEEVLGIEGIGIEHNFFEIGGNSINIIKVINLINQIFAMHVSMSELFLRPTIAEIAGNLFTESPLQGLECVVRLNRPTPGKKNIFIIHNWEGIIYQYRELAKLLEGQCNFYGIQAKGVIEPTKLPETIEEMLNEYIMEMKTVQSEGPFIIGGYCYGNWLAYKMADMLEEAGVSVEKLIMIDENVFIPEKAVKLLRIKYPLVKPYKVLRRLVRRITRRGLNPMDQWSDIYEYREANPSPQEFTNQRTVRDNIGHLCTGGYSLKNLIQTDTHVIKARENNLPRFTATDWETITYGKVSFIEIAGDHESIFSHPYVEELAKAVLEGLEIAKHK